MSVSIKTVEFERREAHLSELEDGPPFTVHGVALGAGDVTVGASGIKKVWPEEELRKAVDTLEGRSLVEDHDNSSRGVVGEVTKVGFKDGVGIIYEAELDDEELAESIKNGRLEVSIRGKHMDVDQMEENEDGAKVVRGITFENLSIVPTGAAPSNTIEIGEAEELSVAELAAFTAELQEDEEIEAGTFVQWGENQGIVLTMPEDGEVEVDLYEESDGTWRSTGETEMVSVGDLSVWDVDEDDIGAREEEDDDEEEEEDEESDESDEEEAAPPEDFIFDSEDEARAFIEGKDGLTGVHEMDDGWMPGDTHEEFAEWHAEKHGEEEEAEEEPIGTDEDVIVPDGFGFDSEEDALSMAEQMEISGVHKVALDDEKTVWVPGSTHEDFLEAHRDIVDGEDELGKTRIEGEEKPLDSDPDLKESRREDIHRYVDSEIEELTFDEIPAELFEELEGSVHEPTFDGRDSNEWNKPSLNDFTDESWEDISDSEKSDIGGHFLYSLTGFPADNFGDMKLPVVRPSGTLSMNAVDNADARLGQTDGPSEDQRDRLQSIINGLQGDEEENTGEGVDSDEEEATHPGMQRPRTIDDTGHEPNVENTGPVDVSLDLINKYLRIEGNHERDKVDGMLSWMFGATDLPMETMSDFRAASNTFLNQTEGTDSFAGLTVEQFRDWLLMHGDGSRGRREQEEPQQRGELPPGRATPVHVLTGDDLRQGSTKSGESELGDITTQVIHMTNEELEEKLEELNEPVAVEQSDLEELQQKANRFEEMSSTLEDLKERTDILDDVDRDSVEELADADEPVVVESTRIESLEEEAEQVKSVYAAALAEQMPGFDAEELADRFEIEELREKYEEQIGDLEEELEAEPKSGDPSEEELEEAAEEEEQSEEELEEQEAVQQKQEELRELITGN